MYDIFQAIISDVNLNWRLPRTIKASSFYTNALPFIMESKNSISLVQLVKRTYDK